ncbi:MAG: hypothetical protein HY321_15690 [Armatimonadetes bacterium]|nr:hypothetical protein [Armatimonadota bacterium]
MSDPGGMVERLWGGAPIIAPQGEGWESGHTYNAAAVRLPPSDAPLIRGLLGRDPGADPARRDGIVAIFYRAQPLVSPGFPAPRSSIGLALFTPELRLLRRLPEPVMRPSEDLDGFDRNGVEDPRVTRLGDTFYLVYCGFATRPGASDLVQVCLARSDDLLHWEKLGPVPGEVNTAQNKDGVLFPEAMDGRYFLLHRPMVGPPSQFRIELAVSNSPTGVWRNCGPILAAPADPICRHAWPGAGSVPIPLGERRYLAIHHTGHRLKDGRLWYTAGAALLDFRRFSPDRPAAIVETSVERLLVPETPFERSRRNGAPVPLDCVFPCGSYEHDSHVHVVYGGRDSYTLAARVDREALLARLRDAAPRGCDTDAGSSSGCGEQPE